MDTVIIVIIIAIAIALIFVLVFRLATIIVFGWRIKENTLDKFLGKNLGQYRLNSHNNKIMSHDSLPCITTCPPDIAAAWYIMGYGTIPHLSKWNKILNHKRSELLAKSPKSSPSRSLETM